MYERSADSADEASLAKDPGRGVTNRGQVSQTSQCQLLATPNLCRRRRRGEWRCYNVHNMLGPGIEGGALLLRELVALIHTHRVGGSAAFV